MYDKFGGKVEFGAGGEISRPIIWEVGKVAARVVVTAPVPQPTSRIF